MIRSAVVPARWILLAAVLLASAPAGAYEFEVRARTLNQAFELRSFRLAGADIRLGRRRFTQALTLEIRDIGDLAAKREKMTPHRRGPTVSFSSYLRLDHDFGDWTMGELERDGDTVDAIDGIPELASSSLALDLLYAYVAIEDLAGGVVDLEIGRQVRMDLLDSWAYDGVTAEVHTPWHLGIEVAGGLRLLDSSPLAPSAYELDGTSGADCREYVEGEGGAAGSWQIIDRSRVPGTSPFTADLDYCPQREQLMPTIGVAVVTEGIRSVHARLSYRRSASRTVGLIGEEDRLDTPDEGLYPEPLAPKWGIDEERVALVVHGAIDARDGRILVTPFAGARWSLLHGLADELVAGTRVKLGDHALEPEVSRSVPTFDGDSIFNVFAIEPSTDARLGYSWAPRHGALRAHGGTWLRRYDLGDDAEVAGGATAGGRWTGRALAVRLDALLDGGWGGRRAGGSAGLTWQARRWARYAARASLLHLDDETERAVYGALQLGASWQVVDGAAFHVFTETTTSRNTPFQVRVLGMLDLQFIPEI